MNYQIAIRIYKNDIGFHYKKMRIDFLLDGKLLHKGNVLFVVESLKLPSGYQHELESRGYRYVFAYRSALEKLFFARQAWKRLLESHKFKHYVVYNDLAPSHRVRNKVMGEYGVETWYYNHSCDFLHRYAPIEKMEKVREKLYEGLEYDHMIVAGKDMEDFYKRQGCEIGKYHRLGGIWNELARRDNI